MQVTGRLRRLKLLRFAGFPTSEAPGADASDEEIERLTGRCVVIT